jgi:hypothetical protein
MTIVKDPNQVGKTILKQLGGNKFVVMTGAKNITADKNYLVFKIGRNASKATHVKIMLDLALDTYDIEFIQCRGTAIKSLRTLHGVHAEDLRTAFTLYTGLETSL